MIRASAVDDDGRPIYIFGLSRENINRLMEDRPIMVDLQQEFGSGGIVIIIGGETEEAIALELGKHIKINHVEDRR